MWAFATAMAPVVQWYNNGFVIRSRVFDSPLGHQLSKDTAMKRMLEIRAAEGGEDSKLFVNDLAQAYLRLAQRLG